MGMMVSAELSCFHCGEPIPSGIDLAVVRDGQSLPVCCAGCQAVAELIQGAGFGRYYQFRQSLARKAEDDVAALTVAWQGCDARESMWGRELKSDKRELLLQIEGIRCAACAWLIRSHLESRPGIGAVQVDTATGYTRIDWNPQKTRLSEMARALLELGYKPHLPLAGEEAQARQQERRDALKRLGVAGLGMMQVMIRVFFEGAIRSLLARRPGMDVPVALAIGLAFIASCINFFRGAGEVWFDSVVMFIFFLSLGRYIEMILRHRNLQAGAALARLMPEWAERLSAGSAQTIPAADLAVGDRVRVRAGESFPADGIILTGETEVDEALMTGESRPVLRRQGEAVIAATINMSQPVEIEVNDRLGAGQVVIAGPGQAS
jgi:Cu2+-exporting ATPase